MIFNLFRKKGTAQEDFHQDLPENRPSAVQKERQWDKTQTLMSKTDKFGTINFVNDAFVKVSGYSEAELMGQPHNLIRHPDMPKVIFKVLWDNILEGNNFHGIVKNLSKTGEYYWVITNFSVGKDANGQVSSFLARRVAVPDLVITKYIEPLYKRLLEIEKSSGVDASGEFLNYYFEQIGKDYTQFVYDIMKECGGNTDFLSESVLNNPFVVKKESIL